MFRAPLALLLAGCAGSDRAPRGRPVQLEVRFESPAPTVATVRWDGGVGHVVAREGGRSRVSPDGDGLVRLVGLAAGVDYDAELVLDDGRTQEFAFRAPPQPDRPAFVVTDRDPDRSAVDDGYVMMALVTEGSSWALMIDGEGRTAWSIQMPPEDIVIDVRPGRDEASVLYAQLERTRSVDRGVVHRVGLDGSPLRSTRVLWAHHMFRETSDGRIGWLGHDFRDVGWGAETWSVFTDTVLEAPEGAPDETTTEELYNFFDDYGPFFLPCPHPTYAEERFGLTDLHEWTHSNSILLSEDERSWYIAPRLFDALLKIDRQTGETVWQMGGAANAFTPITDDPDGFWWSHAHLSELWDTGGEAGFVMFDNGSHKTPPVSSVAEYRFDEAARTVEKVWSYDDPLGRFVPYLGDVRRLPNGNYLVAWSPLSMLTELTPEGEVVWRAQAEEGAVMGRVVWIADPHAPAAAP